MSKQKKIDAINDAFIEILTQDSSTEYERFIKSVRREMIQNIETLTEDKVKQIVMREKLNIKNVTLLFAILNSILLIINNPRKKREPQVLPIVALAGMYALSRPKTFVKKVLKVAKGKNLNTREKQARAHINAFASRNSKSLDIIRKQAVNNMKTSVAKTSVNKRMMEDFFELRQQGKSIDTIERTLTKRYTDKEAIQRTLRTELHSQSEFVKKEHSKTLGYTFKIWKTQGDERVRDTVFHNQVKNTRVPIDEDFIVGANRAQAPGDESLPPKDRMNCRCYLIYK